MKSLLLLVALIGLSIAAAPKRAGTSCNCGWVNSGRIVGGIETVPNKYPWMVSLHINRRPMCGASIITPWHALTAAHCGVVAPAYSMQIVVGAHNIHSTTEKSTAIQIAQVINHRGYDDDDMATNFDIALLVTAKQIPFSKTVGPVCMPSRPLRLDNQFIKVTGWGNIRTHGHSSDVLREVDLKVMPTSQCSRHWTSLQQKLCAYGVRKDSCQGDSGGPLVWLDPEINRYTQVALVSYGEECGGPKPSVNTDVSTYISWINQQIQSSKPGVRVCRKN